MNRISVISLNSQYCFYEKKIKETARKFLKLLEKENCHLAIFLITGSEMKFLNKKFRNKNKATDILTFVEPGNFPHPESKLKFLGEIYLNAEVPVSPPAPRASCLSDRQACLPAGRQRAGNFSPYGRSPEGRQFSRLLIHGLLHLFGFQHRKKSDSIKMEKLEQLMIKKLGN
ncbi:MAG: rRNA maturation RNase YbeY [Patescibacteria group bacterium]